MDPNKETEEQIYCCRDERAVIDKRGNQKRERARNGDMYDDEVKMKRISKPYRQIN